MPTTYYKTIFKLSKDLGLYKTIPGIEEAMQSELIRCYNIYADKSNSGVTDMLNDEFNKLYPNYFKENSDKEWYDLIEYNEYMAKGYMKYIVSDMNINNASEILNFYVDPNEMAFKGMLKTDSSIQIEFFLKPVEI